MILKSQASAVDSDKSEMSTNWFYDKTELRRTKSILDGISYETEQRYRREGARFIIKVGSKMNLRYDTMATGVVYFHRFYMCHSFKQFPRFVTACCCLFLAGKVEETPKKCKDIIKAARGYLTDLQLATFNEDPKEEVLTLERILLQTINFDLQVDHPYPYLLKYAKALRGDKEKLQKMVQMAWTFINDSLCTTICLQWEPEIIAIALMFLAGKLSKFEVTDWEGRTPKQSKWWDMFVEDISLELLEDICHQVLDLYSVPIPDTPQDSPPPSPVQHAPPALPGGLPPSSPAIVSPSVITQTGVASTSHVPLTGVPSVPVLNASQPFPSAGPYRYPNQFQAIPATQASGPSTTAPPPPPPPPVPPGAGAPWDFPQYFQNMRPHGFSGAQSGPPSLTMSGAVTPFPEIYPAAGTALTLAGASLPTTPVQTTPGVLATNYNLKPVKVPNVLK